jgi:hypothetical protein
MRPADDLVLVFLKSFRPHATALSAWAMGASDFVNEQVRRLDAPLTTCNRLVGALTSLAMRCVPQGVGPKIGTERAPRLESVEREHNCEHFFKSMRICPGRAGEIRTPDLSAPSRAL